MQSGVFPPVSTDIKEHRILQKISNSKQICECNEEWEGLHDDKETGDSSILIFRHRLTLNTALYYLIIFILYPYSLYRL